MRFRRSLALLLGTTMLLSSCSGTALSAVLPVLNAVLPALKEESTSTGDSAPTEGQAPVLTPTQEPLQAIQATVELPKLLDELPTLYDTTLAPNLPTYTVEPDLSNVLIAQNMPMDYWSEEAIATLAQNGFLVKSDTYLDEFYQLYEGNRYSLIPNYVTTDAMLHAYHQYFQHLQRNVEENHLFAQVVDLTTRMLQGAEQQLEALQGTAWENAARRNVAYFAVAASLLDPAASVPASVSDLVAQELDCIERASGIETSVILSTGSGEAVLEDYTQYIPRSYYTTSETLTRYFKALMWYGRLPFLASDADLTRSAMLINQALQQDEQAQTGWDTIYQVTSFFAGASDDATCADYTALMQAVYGEMPDLQTLSTQEDRFAAFQASLSQLRPAAINSVPVFEDEDREEATQGFRFMGQRYSIDGSIFQRLVYREMEPAADGTKRSLPDLLDVPAALGSDTALDLLKTRRKTDYPNFDSQMQAVRNALSAAPDTLWSASLSSQWINTLRPLTVAHGEGWPQFMQTEAWRTKSLTTLLGSWTELKHDTALYAKQVYAEMGGGGWDPEDPDDRGWVEAEPAVFGRLAALTEATAEGLNQLGLLDNTDAENLDRMASLNRQLMTIAEKELRNELPTDEEFDLIRSFGGQLEHFWDEAVRDEANEIYSPMNAPAALVTDVATNPDAGTVLEAATDLGEIYVITYFDGKPRLMKGAVFTLYQFESPISERMTDERWRDARNETVQVAERKWENVYKPVDWMDVYAMPSTEFVW